LKTGTEKRINKAFGGGQRNQEGAITKGEKDGRKMACREWKRAYKMPKNRAQNLQKKAFFGLLGGENAIRKKERECSKGPGGGRGGRKRSPSAGLNFRKN